MTSNSETQTTETTILRRLLNRLLDPGAARYDSFIALRTYGRATTMPHAAGETNSQRGRHGTDDSPRSAMSASPVTRGSAA